MPGALGTIVSFGPIVVSTSASTVLVPAPSGLRFYASVVNQGPGVLWLRADGGQAVVGCGIPVAPGAERRWEYPLTGNSPAPGITGIMDGSVSGAASGEYAQ